MLESLKRSSSLSARRGSRESYLYVLQRAPSTALGMTAAAERLQLANCGVRSGAFCSLSGSAWFMLGCAITGGR